MFKAPTNKNYLVQRKFSKKTNGPRTLFHSRFAGVADVSTSPPTELKFIEILQPYSFSKMNYYISPFPAHEFVEILMPGCIFRTPENFVG